MVASAIFLMDTKGKVIVARNYRGDIPMNVSERYPYVICVVVPDLNDLNARNRFSLIIQEKEESDLRPVFTEDGITFVYTKVSLFLFSDSLRCLAYLILCSATILYYSQ